MFLLSRSIFQGLLCSRRYVAKTSYLVRQRLHAEAQKHRGLIQVQGAEASSFLQGLVTNDVQHLEDGANSMYTMFLNTQGRILFDSIIHKKQGHTFILECDISKVQQLVRHLKMYRVRRKVDVDPVDSCCVWSLFENDINLEDITPMDMDSLYMNPKSESKVDIELTENPSIELLATRDPRLRHLGHRVIVPTNVSVTDVVPGADICEGLYRQLRYRLGVSEGVEEIPPTKCFPLEANCDYMHGVSFHKGCYIGQELTARTFHTGVVRKRYMPLAFSGDASKLPFDSSVTNEKGKAVGKVRGVDGHFGIGLMRIEECMTAEKLTVENLDVTTFRPTWWPFKAAKERAK